MTLRGISAAAHSTRPAGRTLASQVMAQLFGHGSMPLVPAYTQRQRRAVAQPSPWARVESSVTDADLSHLMTVLKPFLMVASVAFVAGFAGYLAIARMSYTVDSTPTAATLQAPISAPATAEWNAPKQI